MRSSRSCTGAARRVQPRHLRSLFAWSEPRAVVARYSSPPLRDAGDVAPARLSGERNPEHITNPKAGRARCNFFSATDSAARAWPGFSTACLHFRGTISFQPARRAPHLRWTARRLSLPRTDAGAHGVAVGRPGDRIGGRPARCARRRFGVPIATPHCVATRLNSPPMRADVLVTHGITCSMSRRGNCYDCEHDAVAA